MRKCGRVLGILLLLGPLAWADGPAPVAPGVTLGDLLGDLAEAADEIATVHPVAAPAPPWIDDLLDLSRRGVLTDPADVARARALVDRVRAWQEADAATRCGRQASANVAMDARFGAYVRATLWRPPFLLCHATGERITDAEYLSIGDPAQRAARRAEIRGKQEDGQPLLESLAVVVDRVQTEFLSRFGERCGLRPLSAAYGGAPDLPVGLRSFQDGVATVLWVFADERALAAHLQRDPEGAPLARVFGLVFEPTTAWGITHVGGDAAAARARVAYLAARQLLYWHTRQRNRWKAPPRDQGAFAPGLSAWLASVAAPAADGEARHASERAGLRTLERAFAKQAKPYPVFPTRLLLSDRALPEALQHGSQTFGIDSTTSLLLFRQQAFALFAFLDEADQGRRREAIPSLLEAVLAREAMPQGARTPLGLRDDAEWIAFDEAYAAFVRGELLAR